MAIKKQGLLSCIWMLEWFRADIIAYQKIPIELSDTYQTLHDKLSLLGSSLLIETLPSIVSGENQRIKQNQDEVTYGYNIKREEEKLDFNSSMLVVYNKIRGLNPDPGSYFLLNGKTVKVYGASMIDDDTYQEKQNGEIVNVSKEGIYVKVSDGLIKITEIKMEGKNK